MGQLSLVFVSVVDMYNLYWKYLFCYRSFHWLAGIWSWKFHVRISDLGEVALETRNFFFFIESRCFTALSFRFLVFTKYFY